MGWGMGTGVMGMGEDGEKLVGIGWVWGEQVVPVQLASAHSPHSMYY